MCPDIPKPTCSDSVNLRQGYALTVMQEEQLLLQDLRRKTKSKDIPGNATTLLVVQLVELRTTSPTRGAGR